MSGGKVSAMWTEVGEKMARLMRIGGQWLRALASWAVALAMRVISRMPSGRVAPAERRAAARSSASALRFATVAASAASVASRFALRV